MASKTPDIWEVAHRIKRWRVKVVNGVGVCGGCTPRRHEHTWAHEPTCDMYVLRRLCRDHEQHVNALLLDDFDD